MKKIVLASASPRRKALLENLGLVFEAIPADIDETIDGEFSEQLIEKLALDKADYVAQKLTESAIVIGSDTVVVVDNQILGKPKDKDDAERMLKLLSGKTHEVISAIALIDTSDNTILCDSVISKVKFRKLEDSEIENYINTGEPDDKAGAYAIQGFASVFVESIDGCYNNIVGISVYKLAQMLKKFGINIL